MFADVRFPNEADWVLRNGGLLYRMEGDPAAVRATSQRDTTHASETALDAYTEWTAVIQNTGTKEQLREYIAREIVAVHRLSVKRP